MVTRIQFGRWRPVRIETSQHCNAIEHYWIVGVRIKNGGEKAGLDSKTAWLVQGGVVKAAWGFASNSLPDASWTWLHI